MDIEQPCNECGSDEWREVEELQDLYPERRSRDRDKTERRVFICRECGAEGRWFEDGQDSTVTLSGALRQ